MMSTLIIMYVKTFANNQINLMNVYYLYYTKNKTVFFYKKKAKFACDFLFASCKSKFGTFKYTRNEKATICIKMHAYFHKKNISACAQKQARLKQQPTRPDDDNDRKIEFNKWLPRMHKINKNELVQSLR